MGLKLNSGKQMYMKNKTHKYFPRFWSWIQILMSEKMIFLQSLHLFRKRTGMNLHTKLKNEPFTINLQIQDLN
jgi:hypothetical protein